MKIIFLGTSSGKTSANRFHSSLVLSFKDYNLLVDSGEGTSRALINCKIDFNSIDGILLTHLHPDHFAGLPGLITQMKMHQRKKSLQIFSHNSLKSTIENFLINSYVLPERMKFKIEYITFNEIEKIRITEKFGFSGRKNSHLSKLENYKSVYPSLNLFSGSFLFEIEGKKIVYTSDVGSEADLLIFDDVAPDIFITEVNHISPQSALNICLNSAYTKILLTHYSDEDFPNISEILASLPNSTRERIIVAQDRQIIEI